jgi:hypothetical protein
VTSSPQEGIAARNNKQSRKALDGKDQVAASAAWYAYGRALFPVAQNKNRQAISNTSGYAVSRYKNIKNGMSEK